MITCISPFTAQVDKANQIGIMSTLQSTRSVEIQGFSSLLNVGIGQQALASFLKVVGLKTSMSSC